VAEFNVRKYERLCMRFAAECEGLAADAPEPDLRAHLLRMASMFSGPAPCPALTYDTRPGTEEAAK
jgi:hypothetical protein